MIWLRFFAAQLVMLLATVLGWFVLIPFCLSEAWAERGYGATSLKDGRAIDHWSWTPLNYIYGNPEDGVSGKWALLAGNQPYMPNAWAPWRAYLWSGWRNSADNLKYVFACSTCPLKTFTLFGRPGKIGWQIENYRYKVPVISWG